MTEPSNPNYRPLVSPSARMSLVIGVLTAAAFILLGLVTLNPHPEWDFRRVIWLPSGLSVSVLLIFGWRYWPWILFGSFLVTMVDSGPLLYGLATATTNAGEAVLAFWLLRRVGFTSRFDRGRDVVAFLVLGAAVPTAALAPVSVMALRALSPEVVGPLHQIWFYWALTHALGILILSPLVLTAATKQHRTAEGSWWEGVAMIAVLAVVCVVVFGPPASVADSPFRIAFAPLPVLIWAAFRFGPLGAAAGGFLVSVIAMVGTVRGYGPFVDASPNVSLFLTWSFVNVSSITTLLVAAFVAHRRSTERALGESDGRLRAILEATGDGIIVLDRDGMIRHVNGRFIEMWDLDSGMVHPGSTFDVFKAISAQLKDSNADAGELRRRLVTSDSSTEPLRLKNGRTLEYNSVPVAEAAGLVGRIWFYRDVTAAANAEQERMRLEEQVLHGQKLESLGILAGGIAHDFNNLLLAIMGNADLALDALPSDSESGAHIQHIVTATQRAAGLSQQMLAYSGRGTFAIEPIDLEQSVRELVGLLESSVSKRADLRFEFTDFVPPILGDAAQIHQIIMNLVTNASDALEGRDGKIRVRLGVCDCTKEYLASGYVDDELPPGKYVYLEVEDTGVGMDAVTKAKIFDPFFTSKETGRGLGLASTLGIVRGHHAAIHVDSEVDSGSTFRVLFPWKQVSGTQDSDAQSSPERGPTTGTVLVVDDEDLIRSVAARILTGAGLTVIEAPDGVAAVRVFREKGGGIDVVLLDMTMPNLDGVQTLKEIRSLNMRVPVILTSGFTEAEMADKINDNQMIGFLQKPYRRATLVSKIQEALYGQ